MKPTVIVISLVVLLVLAGCQSAPAEIDEELSQAELIQLAQEASDSENWDAAVAYYNAILDRFPDDRASVATARYEIAFIEYKRGNVEEALAGFERLEGMYDFEPEGLPPWPLRLKEVIVQKIELEQENAEQTNATAGE